ncbi:MAG: ABC transporter permease [Thermomicrobiales bacterium]|nr:ABC transporter permease [Thermomicrobiales bacterium]
MADPAAILEPAALPPDMVDDDPPVRGSMSLRGILSILLSNPSGRAGVALFLVLIGISAWVLLTYPSDFGPDRWSAPLVWADNPKTAPPSWTRLWNDNAVEHQVAHLTEPAATEERGPAEVRSYDAVFVQESASPPQFLSATIEGVTYHDRAPIIIITLLRPDGGEIRLANIAVTAPRPGEEAPYERFFETPERVLLTQQDTARQAIAEWFAATYPDTLVSGSVALNAALFGVPAADGALETLPGEYTIRTQFVVANADDTLEEVEVIYGGTVYGLMGTDSLGRDLFEGLLFGFPVALVIAALASVLSTLIGASLGIISGYVGGATDTFIQRLADIVSNVPVLPLLIFLVFIVGSNLYLIILVLVAFSWTGLTIVVRSMVLQLRSGQLVESAKALGASRGRIMLRHVFPQVAPFIVAQMIFSAPGAILAEASLSFLGLGDPSIPTWGQMLEAGFRTGALYVGYWWWVIPPGVLIIVTAMAFMLLALGMEQVVDPRLREP